MNFNQLSKLVFQKYRLRFKPAVPGSKELYVLASPLDGQYFAIMSRIKQGAEFIAVLDLRCGSFSEIIRDLPGFSTAFRLKSNDWVGLWLDRVNRNEVESALDYAFKLAMNDEKIASNQQPYIFIPGEQEDEKYQAQAITPKKELLKKRHQKEVPKAIEKMRASYDYSILPAKGRAKNFYHQGKLMENYEDDFHDFAAFKRFYPTYHDMTTIQLRTYFTWRSQIRKKQYQKVSTSYAFIYVYELLNEIGVADAKAAYLKLKTFLEEYAAKYDAEVAAYGEIWLKDFAVYHHLFEFKDELFADEIKEDQLYHLLLHPEDSSPQELSAALAKLAPYLTTCLSKKKLQDTFDQIMYQVWRQVLAVKRKDKQDFFQKYVAVKNTLVQNLFAGAVFYAHGRHELQDYPIDSERKYFYQNNSWYCANWYPVKRQKSELNAFVHEVDRLTRQAFHLGRPLKKRKIESEFLQAISQGIILFKQKEAEAKRPKIEINFKQLSQIRSDASVTRDSLLTDEEKALEQEELQGREPQDTVEEADNATNDYVLSKDELQFLIALLRGQNWQQALKAKHLMPSILADSINDKLIDEIGDTVIDFDASNQPEIIEDYLPDLKEMFLGGEK